MVDRPRTAVTSASYRVSATLTERSILRTATSRRAYTATAHRIPAQRTPSPVPHCPPPAAFFPQSPSAPRLPGVDFFLSSEQNRSDDFLAAMKAMSNNFTSTSAPLPAPPPGRAPLISRQFAFTAENHRRELLLTAQLAAAATTTDTSPAATPPLSSTLSRRGGYINHAPDRPVSVEREGRGEGRAASYRPGYWAYATFVPVCVRGPALAFGSGRGGLDDVGEAKRRIQEDRRRLSDSERRRQRKQKERRTLGEEQKQQTGHEEGKEERGTSGKAVADVVGANSAIVTAAARQDRLKQAMKVQRARQQQARAARERLQQEVDARHATLLHRHTAEYRLQRAKAEEEAERRAVLQRSWLLVLAVGARTEWWRASIEHYQSVMRTERAVKVIVRWLHRCNDRRRNRRFLHARRRVRLFFEQRALTAALMEDEARKRRQLELVLSFLQAALSRRQYEVLTAFSSLHRHATVIQRAWRGFLVTQRWRLYTQTLQFITFDQHADAYDAHDDRDAANPATPSLPRRPTSAGRPPSRSNASASASSASRAATATQIPKARALRYLRFTSPLVRSAVGAASTASELSASLGKWNAMVRLQRAVFLERLLDEARLHRVHSHQRHIDRIRDDISGGLGSPRAGLQSPRPQLRGPAVCKVEWPPEPGTVRLRRVLLTVRQLHELHRRTAKACAAGGPTGGESTSGLESLHVVATAGRYVRRAAAVQEGEAGVESTEDGQWRVDGRGQNGFVAWAEMKRWSTMDLWTEDDSVEREERERDAEITVSRQRAQSIVEVAATDARGSRSSLALFQQHSAALRLRGT